jgi:hypothetical protein
MTVEQLDNWHLFVPVCARLCRNCLQEVCAGVCREVFAGTACRKCVLECAGKSLQELLAGSVCHVCFSTADGRWQGCVCLVFSCAVLVVMCRGTLHLLTKSVHGACMHMHCVAHAVRHVASHWACITCCPHDWLSIWNAILFSGTAHHFYKICNTVPCLQLAYN